MNTKINLTYKDVSYCLEYDRMSVKMLEANGFSVEEFIKKPLSNIELAFAGAFIKHHRKTKQSIIDEIYAGCKKKTDLVAVLVTMIEETYDSLLSEPEGDEGNVTWEVADLSPKKSHE